MTIKAILDGKGHDVASISGTASVNEAVAMLAERRIGAVPVVDNGEVRGIFSERDVVYGLAKTGVEGMSGPVANVMTSPPVTVTSDTAVMAALSLMTRRRIRHLPVVDDGALIGFISIGDLVKYRIDRIESEAAAMRDYIQGA
jgi:CBS domain-containing protein